VTDQFITIWLDSLDRVGPDGYRALQGPSALPAAVRSDSALWSERFFTPAADPHVSALAGQARWSYHLSTELTPDLVRCQYTAAGLALDLIESRAYTVLRVRESDPPTRDRVMAIAESVLLKPPGTRTWRFDFAQPLAEGAWFSTNPSVGPTRIATWELRVDGGIRGGGLYFLRFKKTLPQVGYPNLRRWFDDEFRARG
jgi:hypothetical protein